MRKRNFVLPVRLNFAFTFAVAVGLLIFWNSQSFAAGTEKSVKSTKSKKLDANLYEQDARTKSLTGKVKAVREIQEETEVFLDAKSGSSGPYVLPQNTKNRAAALLLLTRSQKPGGPSVKLEVDDQQRIKSVEDAGGSSDKDSSGSQWEF